MQTTIGIPEPVYRKSTEVARKRGYTVEELIVTQIQGSSNAWTDAYLAVFASHLQATVITFDWGFKRLGHCKVLMLSA